MDQAEFLPNCTNHTHGAQSRFRLLLNFQTPDNRGMQILRGERRTRERRRMRKYNPFLRKGREKDQSEER